MGERGENLSVGERQLVALARAQLADPGLLILDEATSAVDPETDQALTQALQRLAEGRTMISIAHRLSTAEVADLILVFDRSRLVDVGTHRELVARGSGVYNGLYQAWLGNTRTNGGRTGLRRASVGEVDDQRGVIARPFGRPSVAVHPASIDVRPERR